MTLQSVREYMKIYCECECDDQRETIDRDGDGKILAVMMECKCNWLIWDFMPMGRNK